MRFVKANNHWSHTIRLGPRHRIGPLQNSQQFGQRTEKRFKSLPSQCSQKYDNNSARNTLPPSRLQGRGFSNRQNKKTIANPIFMASSTHQNNPELAEKSNAERYETHFSAFDISALIRTL
jgi:hypothetical protein